MMQTMGVSLAAIVAMAFLSQAAAADKKPAEQKIKTHMILLQQQKNKGLKAQGSKGKQRSGSTGWSQFYKPF